MLPCMRSTRWLPAVTMFMMLTGSISAQTTTPPTELVYGPNRESTGWVTIRGTQSPIDKGIEFQGKMIYLTLMFDVVVVDAKTKNTVWSDSVGAYWDTLKIVNISKKDNPERWGLELGSSKQPAYKQRYELDTGKKLPLLGAPALPEGKVIAPRKEWHGSAGQQKNKFYHLVSSEAAWKDCRQRLFPADLKDLPEAKDIDFTKEVLLVCYAGETSNWKGITVDLVVDTKEHLLIRLYRHTYQSMGKSAEEHPYGLIVLPRIKGKDYVLEYNRQNLIGGPPNWKEFMRLEVDPAKGGR